MTRISIGTRAAPDLIAALDAEAAKACVSRAEVIYRILQQWQANGGGVPGKPVLVALRAVYEVDIDGRICHIEVAPGCAPVALGDVPPEAIRAVMEGVR